MLRKEDPRFLIGRGRFIDDITLPNMAHAAALRSPHAHARIKSINTSAALALPGVVAVITGEDAAKETGPLPCFANPWSNNDASHSEKCVTLANRSRWWSPIPAISPKMLPLSLMSNTSCCRRYPT